MNEKEYLRRIKVERNNVSVDVESLNHLQRQHLLHIPFENLDIHWKRPIALDFDKFYQKIVEEKRGGFCYELNGLFFKLLEQIGFRSKIISARVTNRKGGFGAEFDHMAIVTKVETQEYIVDVGFGSFTAKPLKFILNVEQQDETGVFLIRKFDEKYFEIVKKDGENLVSENIFTELNRDLSEFAGMCHFHQTSPESHFTRGKVCSVMTPNGRKTLTDKKFIETKNAQKSEVAVDSDEMFNHILEREFQIKRSF
jgi:N-hydroxyarylamine O-acetyltransferase